MRSRPAGGEPRRWTGPESTTNARRELRARRSSRLVRTFAPLACCLVVPTHNGHGKKNGMSRARSTTDDDTETEDFNAAAFWRAPVGPPPTDAAAAKGATIAGPETVRAAIAAAEREAAAKAAAKKDAEKAAAEKAAAEKAAAEERRRKVAAYLMPMPLEEMSYEMIKERLYTFQQQWWARHGRRVTPEDERAGRVPVPIINLYTELGKRLTPEQVAADKARVEARQAAEKEAAAKAKADADAAAEADAARIASCKEAVSYTHLTLPTICSV